MDQHLEEYILHHITPEDPVLYELYRETNLKVVNPRMAAGHLQGSLLTLLSKMIHPTFILEIGTFTGYSSICLAKGLKENGELHTIEANDEIRDLALKYFKKAGVEKSINLMNGNALEIIPTLDFQYDIVFIDAEKNDYLKYYHLVFDKIRSGGCIFADNTLWDGKVADAQVNDRTTESLREFNQFIKNDSRVSATILPLRDGFSVIMKK